MFDAAARFQRFFKATRAGEADGSFVLGGGAGVMRHVCTLASIIGRARTTLKMATHRSRFRA
jgi:hypothetical protein